MSGCAAEVPRVDVLKEEHQFTLIADLPGFTKKDVDVKVSSVLAPFSCSFAGGLLRLLAAPRPC